MDSNHSPFPMMDVSKPSKRFSARKIFEITTALVFYVFIVWTLVRNLPEAKLKAHPTLLKSLLSGSDQTYILAGSEMAPFKPFLPDHGTFTLIADDPFEHSDEKGRKFYWESGNYLCPIILNGYPREEKAIVYCANQAVANRRLNETGYRWIKILADGKGLAEKI